jgi:hypothetical protein
MFHKTSGRKDFNPLVYKDDATLMVNIFIAGEMHVIYVGMQETWAMLSRRVQAFAQRIAALASGSSQHSDSSRSPSKLPSLGNRAAPAGSIANMSVDDVCDFLQLHGLSMYESAIRRECVDGEVLSELSEEGCKDLGIKALHRNKLLRCIAARATPIQQ